jgi:hypothetical protein
MALSLSLTRNRPLEAEVAFIAATEILLARTDFRDAAAASLLGSKVQRPYTIDEGAHILVRFQLPRAAEGLHRVREPGVFCELR